jgi:diguanylate cyclase (GGDEF)-like protein
VATEPDITRCLLKVYRHLDLADQFREILTLAVDWSGAEAGFVFRAGENPEILKRTDCSLPKPDPRYQAINDILRRQLPVLDQPEVAVEALGPALVTEEAWGGPLPEWSVIIPVTGEQSGMAGLLLLAGVPRGPDGRAGIHELVDGCRPAIDSARQVEEMRELIIQDDTASCYNRRHFEASLPEEMARAARFGAPLSMIFFDMDNLKRVNTEHGHAMGSRSLYEVSLRVRSKIRKFDKLFRFGGDEFCIILPETEWHGALEVAERVREAIAGRKFLVGLISEPDGVSMTASMGIASYPLHARTPEDMVVRADRAMQRIKSGTKNSIAIAEIQGDEDDG